MVDEHTGESRVVDSPADPETARLLHRAVDGVRGDMTDLRFNTAIAKMIELTNRLTAVTAGGAGTPREVAEALVLMVSPVAPHIGEELWRRLGHTGSVAFVEFPVADPALLTDPSITLPVQVNGKKRADVTVARDAKNNEIEAAVLALDAIQRALDGKPPKKVIVVPQRIVNVVA